jgi:hypothetical protein
VDATSAHGSTSRPASRSRVTAGGRACARACSLVLTLLLSACGLGPDDALDELARNRERWRSQRIADYQVRFRLICFCVLETTEPVILTVRRGSLVSVTRVSDGRPVDPTQWTGRYYTVDEMFALIAEAEARGADEVRVTYDAALGYPREVFLDEDQRLADEERTFELSALAPLG